MTEAILKDDLWIKTTCGGCYGNCHTRVHRVNGMAVKIEGEPDCPWTEGSICGKGASPLQILYDPNRLNYPVKRTNPEKGIGIDPKWQRITWDEALETIAGKLREIYKDCPEAYLHQYTPTTGVLGCYMGIFARAFGGQQNSGGGGLFCGNATHLKGCTVDGNHYNTGSEAIGALISIGKIRKGDVPTSEYNAHRWLKENYDEFDFRYKRDDNSS